MKKRNMNRSMQGMLVIFVVLFVTLGSYLLYSTVTYGEQWFASPYNPRISAAKNIANAGTIYDRNGLALAHSVGDERVYAEDDDVRRAVSHIVGDVYGKSLGAETYFAKYLYGFKEGVFDKFGSAIAGDGKKGSDIYLTIDAELSRYIYNKMEYNGAVVLMNYQTGEVLASVSTPTFDPMSIKNSGEEEEEGSQYLNRVTQGRYPPGSTMKVVTTMAALENGITDLEIDCTGSAMIDGQKVTCPKEGGHGHVDLTSAFERSCNIYYAQLANKLGSAAMQRAAEQAAFNTEFFFPDFNMLKSNFETSGSAGDLGWAGIGQYKDLVTPMHNMLISAGVANGGVMMQPNTLLDVKSGSFSYKPTQFRSIMKSSTAEQLTELMRGTVQNGTATSADIGGAEICGKTGTAEFVEDGQVKNHSWFVGFSQSAQHPLAIAVILEGAGFGSAHATPLAGQVLSKAIELGY